MYFYKLGHQSELGVAEFHELSQKKDFKFSKNWLLSEEQIEVNITGSLVFSGQILDSFDGDWQDNLINLNNKIRSLVDQEKIPKKIGFVSPANFPKNFLHKLKLAGLKKVNWLVSGTFPTYGNFLSTKKWLIVFRFQERTFLGLIEDHYKQQFWSKLDERLPQRDMKRGMINLKLARTMLNFSSNKNIFDPFCGVGRSLLAGIDLKEFFVGSDLDPKATVEAKENFDFSLDWFSKSPIFQDKLIFKGEKFFSKDAGLLENSDFETIKISDFSVVTEGFLGTNFKSKPTIEDINRQLDQQKELWGRVLDRFNQLQIKEAIFCLPFYNFESRQIIPEFILDVIGIYGYTNYLFYNQQPYLLYKRKDSLVGHCIFKIIVD